MIYGVVRRSSNCRVPVVELVVTRTAPVDSSNIVLTASTSLSPKLSPKRQNSLVVPKLERMRLFPANRCKRHFLHLVSGITFA